MTDKERLISDDSIEAPRNVNKTEKNAKLPCYIAGGLLLFWALLFFAVVIPFFYRLPTALTMEDAQQHLFIAERAYKNLYTLSNIGVKVTGSKQNEIETVNFILNELSDIKKVLLEDYFDMDIDLSQVSGTFQYRSSLRMYEGLQNIVVRLTPKNSISMTYLLVNSHFDSQPATPSAGDAGFMIVAMLEVLRVMATSKQTFEHPIVFLFNGAEEGGLQASHGFITQHKWAKNCRAVVNLDAAGSGGRDVLFQSGPNHSWLVNYYQKYIKHPFATTLAEEFFQAGIILSTTDFEQFNNFGNIPGLDMVQGLNGYIYHTKYDVIDIIPRESLQNTGDNVLSIVRGLSNATELHDTQAYNTGGAVFFDFLGLYFIHYSESTGKSLIYGLAAAALILIFISMWRMAAVSQVSLCHVIRWFILVLIIQIISVVLGLALPVLVANTFDSFGLSLTYFSSLWLVICLYVCPCLIGLCLPTTIYFYIQGNDKITNAYHVQLAVHGQAIILALVTVGITALGFRSSYILMIPLIFYVASLALNLLTTLHDRGYAWTGLVKAGQIIPFLCSSYLFYMFVVALVPMQGNGGKSSNPDIIIAVLTASGTLISFGLLIPLTNTFRRPSFIILILCLISAIGMYLASSTQIGFPFRPKTNVQRVQYLQVRNKHYEYDGTLSMDESGYLFMYPDRRGERTLLNTKVNLSGLVSMEHNCQRQMMCGMPLYDLIYIGRRLTNKWLPRSEPIEPPGISTLTMLNKTIISPTTVRLEFSLTGPSRRRLFIQPYEDVEISNWSFLHSYLENPPASPLPYHIHISYGIDSKPLIFYLELKKSNGDFNVPLLQLGISLHYIESEGDDQSVKFASTFPPFAIVIDWPALYERYIF